MRITFAATAAVGSMALAVTLVLGAGKPGPVEWSSQASAEVAHALHEMHEMWNRGDMEAVRKVIAGDDVLVTFDLESDNKSAVALRSRDEILAFMARVETDTGQAGTSYEMEMPKMNCRATGAIGICTEECRVHLKRSGETVRIDKLFGTSVAVKYPDGWKFIQWHMSVAREPEFRPAHPQPATPSAARHTPRPDTDEALKAGVRVIDEYQTPGLESELSGIYPHPTDPNLYYVLANRKPPYRYGQQPMLPVEYRGKLLTVTRAGKVLKAVDLPADHFGGLVMADGVAWVATTNTAEILKADPDTGKVLARYQLPSPAGGLEYDRERGVLIAQLYVEHPHLALVDAKTGRIVGSLWSDESAMGLAKVDGKYLCTWASGWDPGSLSELRIIDQKDGHVRARMRLEQVHSVLSRALDDNGGPAFLSLVTLDSHSGKTVIRRYGFKG
jgi:hypothetical protein